MKGKQTIRKMRVAAIHMAFCNDSRHYVPKEQEVLWALPQISEDGAQQCLAFRSSDSRSHSDTVSFHRFAVKAVAIVTCADDTNVRSIQ